MAFDCPHCTAYIEDKDEARDHALMHDYELRQAFSSEFGEEL